MQELVASGERSAGEIVWNGTTQSNLKHLVSENWKLSIYTDVLWK